ncbi:hypothetical protein EDB81DRAFT_588987, partial [Dactylonectria macrodidyma]
DSLTFRRRFAWEGKPEVDWTEWDNEDRSSLDPNTYQDQYIPQENQATCQEHYDKSPEIQILLDLFKSLGRIDAFSVLFPRAVTCMRFGDEMADCYDIQAVVGTIAAIRSGLQTSTFDHLTDLRLELPSTYFVEQTVDGMDQEARNRLKHLYIRILDQTGVAGCHEWLGTLLDDDSDALDGTTELDFNSPNPYPFSNLQFEYPNIDHQLGLWEFVSSCRNLESLGIEATHYLDLTMLRFGEAPALLNLRVLTLSRLYITSSSLINLCNRNMPLSTSTEYQPCQLQRLSLKDVKIYEDGGDWDEVFTFLLVHCPRLEVVWFHLLTYFCEH